MKRIEAHVFAAERLHGDDTTVPVLAKGKTDTGRCWVYVGDQPRLPGRFIKLGVAAEGVGLKDPGIIGEMPLGMLTAPVARVIKHRRRSETPPAKRSIVAVMEIFA